MTPEEFATHLGSMPARVVPALFDVYKQAAEDTVEAWRENVRASSPKGHLKHLPAAITSEMKVGTSIRAEMGPDASRRQGALGLGDEMGSRNQAPHLSGLRAVTEGAETLGRLADEAIRDLLS